MRSYGALFVLAVVPAALEGQQSLQEVRLKDPAVAGFLSWIVPGLGNFYAGHKGHGWRHVAIDVAGVGFVIASKAAHAKDPGGGVDAAFNVLGIGTLIGNAIWATVSSIKDTEAYNRRAAGGRGRASLELGPRLHRAGLELGRLTF